MLSDRSIPLLDVLFYVAAVFVAFEAIRRTRTPQGAVGWTSSSSHGPWLRCRSTC
jgi:hypothetical protein